MSSLVCRLRATTFRQQLSLTVAAGVLCLALFAAIASSAEGARRIRDTLLRQGANVTGNLAEQSRLALLIGSAENANEALNATLSFPDIIGAELIDADGVIVARKFKDSPNSSIKGFINEPISEAVVLLFEDQDRWGFRATVTTTTAVTSPFELAARDRLTLGTVHVVQSKNTLNSLRRAIFTTGTLVSIGFALLFLLVIRVLAGRLLEPLTELSSSMASAEGGARGVRARSYGPSDIADMARAFNRMMDVLEDRERELIESRDVALAFADMKAQFAATVSHEIRTPLNGVIGTLDMLMASSLPARQQQFAELAWDSASYLLNLVNDVLDFSKLGANKIVLDRSEVDLLQLLEGVVDSLAAQAHQKGLEIGYAVTTDLPRALLGDAPRLRQVLTNLVGNAVKFTQSGEVCLRAHRVEGTEGQRLRIEVKDTGPGVPAEQQGRIFESFTQGDAFSTRRFEGTGLGLAICRQLIDLMGGHIGIASEAGFGSTFWFEIPLEAASAEAVLAPPKHAHSKAVLVVDASQIVQEFCAAVLPSLGYMPEACTSIKAARAALTAAAQRGAPYAIVMADVGMINSLGAARNSIPIDLAHSARRWIVMSPLSRQTAGDLSAWDSLLAKPLRLQRTAACLDGIDSPEDLAKSKALSNQSIGPVRILVVEDNRTNQAVTLGMLSMFGVTAEVAENGVEALDRFRHQAWDVILMDCQMPVKDGYETTQEMRAIEAHTGGHVPIIAMTANVDDQDVQRCLAAGMDDHLAKPFTIDALRAKIRRWLPTSDLRSVSQEDAPEAAIDAAVLDRLRDALGGALREAIQPFLEDMPKTLLALRQAALSADAQALVEAAHRIKGSAGNLGAAPLANAARQMEIAVEIGDLARTDALVEQVFREFDRVETVLRAELSDHVPAGDDRQLSSARVLVVDDDRSTRSALRYALQLNGFQVDEADSSSAAITLLEEFLPDVILMDAVMPGQDGITTCALLKELPHAHDIPVLIITALDDRHSIERAFAAGASDYITKPLHFNVVVQRVRRTVQATLAEKHVRHLAYNDTLTGLPNRALFHDRLKQQIERSKKNGAMLAVLFLDLDRFKVVNDSLGHEIGDRLLAAVAQRVKQCVRTGDSVARLGGDEFTVVLEDLATGAAAASAAQKIAVALSEPFIVDGHDIFVSTSIGISVYPKDGTDISTLLRHADTAMYQAKRTSQGFRFYESSMDAKVGDHLRLETALRRAVERDELSLHFQPELTAAGGDLYCAEALLRWQHPERGMVPPNDFIPLAEETGLIIPIGEWVIRSACEQIKSWIEQNGREVRLAVNLSGKQLQDSRFPITVEKILQENGLSPRHIVFEITESVWMEQAGEALSVLHRLRNMGTQLAIDDFGTGYSSLSYLKRLPVNILKIDRSFIKDITSDESDAAIVRGIVALAHTLKLDVVAEGVESREQLDLLTEMGCTFVQGFLLGRPMPAEQFAQLQLGHAATH